MTRPILLASRAAAQLIRRGGAAGTLSTRTSWPDGAAAVVAVGDASRQVLPCPLDPRHFLARADAAVNGRWFRAQPELHRVWWDLAIREDTLVPRHAIAALIETGFPTTNHPYWMITYVPRTSPRPQTLKPTDSPVNPNVRGTPWTPEVADELEVPELLGWLVQPEGASPVDLDCEPEQPGIATLARGWPVAAVQEAHVLLVGAGSIGSSITYSLADAGVGALTLVDPDRLRWHNLVRHQARPRHVGRHKVSALREDLRETRSDTNVTALTIDAVADADQVRGLLRDSDITVCAADGVAVRRVLSHLCRRATRPAVMACVLEDGAIGEVLRLRPWLDEACLACRREHLALQGALNPEPGLDAGYGTGNPHRPMTAVGCDLRLVGDIAARLAISTLLEHRGQRGHRAPGEHAVLSLRPPRDLAAPFDAERSLELRWFGAPAPRPGCPTCAT